MYPIAVGIACFSLHLSEPPAFAVDEANGLDQEAFFASIEDLVERGNGSSFAYRFRRVGFDCDAATSAPTLLWEGVTRISFRADSILLDEVHFEMTADETELPTPRRVVTHYSLASGEYARSTLLAGGGGETVILDHWSALPQIAYFALGAIGHRGSLEGCGPPELAVDEEGVHYLSFLHERGARIQLVYDLEIGARLRHMRADHPDGNEHDWIQFHDCVPELSAGPLRPTLVTSARVTSEGCVRQVLAWSAIGGEWAEENWQHEVPAGAGIMDFRCPAAQVSEVHTDRPVLLGDLLGWPHPLDHGSEPAPIVYEPTSVDIRTEHPARARVWLFGGGLCAALIVLGMWRSRS